MAGVIPDTGSISLGGTDERSVAALRDIKRSTNMTSMVQMSAMRDWYRAFLSDSSSNLGSAGDEISLGEFRDAGVFGVGIKIRNESATTYDNSANGYLLCRGIDGSGNFSFRLTQDAGATRANYSDPGNCLVYANTLGAIGNNIILEGAGAQAAFFNGVIKSQVPFNLTTAGNYAGGSLSVTGGSSKTVAELFSETHPSVPMTYIIGSTDILATGVTLTLTGGSGSSPASFNGTSTAYRDVNIIRNDASDHVTFSITGNGSSTVSALIAAAGVSANIPSGGAEIVTSGYVVTVDGGSDDTTIEGAVSNWNLANPGNTAYASLQASSWDTLTLEVGETINLNGGAAAYDVTKYGSSSSVMFLGLGGSDNYTDDYEYTLLCKDETTGKQFKIAIKIGTGQWAAYAHSDGTDGTQNAGSGNGSRWEFDTPNPLNWSLDEIIVYLGPEDPDGVNYGPQ